MYNKIIPVKQIVHCSDGSKYQTFEDIERWHRTALDEHGNWRYHYGKPSSLGYYCAYNLVIDWNGKVTQCRQMDERGAHTYGQNDNSIGICLIGAFDTYGPSQAQIDALKGILKANIARFNLSAYEIYPHRKYKPSKTCYGAYMSDTWASDLVNEDPALIDALMRQILLLKDLLNKLLKKKTGQIAECEGC